jgi:hypothetical protein
MTRAVLPCVGEEHWVGQHSEKRLSIARIFAASGNLNDTIAACADARRSSQDALRVLDDLDRSLTEHNAADRVAACIAQAKAYLQRSNAALEYALTNAQTAADTMRFDAA